MKILVTGAGGFIGSFLVKSLKKDKHQVCAATRDILDFRDSEKVATFLEKNRFDVVLHTAVRGGRRTRADTAEDFYQNLLMFENLYMNKDKYSLMINFASGAEFGRTQNINQAQTEDLYKILPCDYYGASKNLIAKKILQTEDMVNLRIFNCFSEDELKDRMIRASCERHINKAPIIVHQNKMMDFFYIEDLYRVVQHYIKNFNSIMLPRDLNLVYVEKVDLLSVAKTINSLTNHRVEIIINDEMSSGAYTGSGTKLEDLKINLLGLRLGVEHVYKTLRERRKYDESREQNI